MGKAIGLLFLLLISPAIYAQTTHTVGGNSGWDDSVNYGDWAKGQTFAVGDSLLFNYGITHAVDEVSEDDYTNCNTGNPKSSESNSPTTITLSAAGTRYFICPRSNHCNQGQKLAVTVAGGTPSPPSGTPSPPSGTPSPPSGGAAPSPPSGGSTPPSSPPPPNGNAATTLGGGKSLMVGLSVVLGALLGVMG